MFIFNSVKTELRFLASGETLLVHKHVIQNSSLWFSAILYHKILLSFLHYIF